LFNFSPDKTVTKGKSFAARPIKGNYN